MHCSGKPRKTCHSGGFLKRLKKNCEEITEDRTENDRRSGPRYFFYGLFPEWAEGKEGGAAFADQWD